MVDFQLERRVQEACRQGIRQGWVNSAHDCAEGGIAVALAECCISGKLGAEINLEFACEPPECRWDEVLFGESASRILVSVKPEQQASWESYLKTHLGDDQYWQKLGVVKGENASLRILLADNQPLIEVTMTDMGDRWHNAIARRLTM